MEHRILEGMWEDITLHGRELVGRKVRVTVLDEPGPRVALDQALAHLIANAEQLVATLPPREISTPPDVWSEAVDEKFRRQGFII